MKRKKKFVVELLNKDTPEERLTTSLPDPSYKYLRRLSEEQLLLKDTEASTAIHDLEEKEKGKPTSQ